MRAKCKTTKKVRFGSRLDARIALAEAQVDRDEKRVYRCRFCLGWHLTSQDRR